MNNICSILDSSDKDQDWKNCESSGMIEIIENFNLAYALSAIGQLSLSKTLLETTKPLELSTFQGIDLDLLEGLFKFLEIHNVAVCKDKTVKLTTRGRQLLHDVSLAQLGFYVEAYGNVASSIPQLLSREIIYGNSFERNGRALGEHCATLFKYFHTDTILTAMEDLQAVNILDLGCGGGQFLVDAACRNSSVMGVGMDISSGAIDFAKDLAKESSVDTRVEFVVGDAFDIERWPEECLQAEVITAVGVLHEHFRDGEEAVISLLNRFASLLKNGVKRLVIGEPEIRMDRQKSDSDLFLVHVFTAQGFPRPREEWIKVFDKSKLKCTKIYTRPNAGPRFNFFCLEAR